MQTTIKAIAFLLAITPIAAAADLSELLTETEYRAAGLVKLTDEEREALYQAIRRQLVGAAATTEPRADPETLEADFGLEEPARRSDELDALEARVLEPFNGWSGKTRFQLDNGQIWQQRSSGRYYYSGDDNRVVISRNALGFYEMRLLDADRAVGVRRLK